MFKIKVGYFPRRHKYDKVKGFSHNESKEGKIYLSLKDAKPRIRHHPEKKEL
jgi:hypothetical protein